MYVGGSYVGVGGQYAGRPVCLGDGDLSRIAAAQLPSHSDRAVLGSRELPLVNIKGGRVPGLVIF